MDWVFDNIQVIIGLAAAIAYWLTNQKAAREARQAEAEAEARREMGEDDFGPEEDWEEAYREVQPPPMMQRQPAPPPFPGQVEAAERELARQNEMMERLKRLKSEAQAAASGTGPRVAKIARIARTARGARTVKTLGSVKPVAELRGPLGLRASLRDKREIRKAVVLHEILRPPVAFRE